MLKFKIYRIAEENNVIKRSLKYENKSEYCHKILYTLNKYDKTTINIGYPTYRMKGII